MVAARVVVDDHPRVPTLGGLHADDALLRRPGRRRDGHRRGRLLRGPPARSVRRALHRHGTRPGIRGRGRTHGCPPAGHGHRLPARDPGPVRSRHRRRRCARGGVAGLAGRDPDRGRCRRRRPTTSRRRPATSCAIPTRFEYDTDVRDHDCSEHLDRRVLRPHQARLLRVLRLDDGGAAARDGCPDAATSRACCRAMGSLGSGRSVVRNRDSHAWVQVYFPGYGWVDFDPTGGPGPRLAPLPSGRPEASASPGATRSPGFLRPQETLPRDQPPGGGLHRRTQDAGSGRAVDRRGDPARRRDRRGVAAVAWRRGPRGPVSADGTYGAVTRLASRLGFAPRPNQTVYEYAGALGDSCRPSGRSSRRWPTPRSRSPTARGSSGRPDALPARGAPTPADRPAPAVRPPRAPPAQPLIAARPARPRARAGLARARRSGCAAPALPGPPRRAAPRGAPSGCGRAGRRDRHETRRR